jgi:hypothetical protein
MKIYKDIQAAIDHNFEEYIADLFTISGESRKYYYWSINFFETVGGLSFQHYNLSQNQKEDINFLGEKYFDSTDVHFIVNKNSHRNDITIKNIHKLFASEKISGQSYTYEYIKEFIFWQLLIDIKNDLFIEIEAIKGKTGTEKETERLNIEINETTSNIKKQKSNFLLTYTTFLCDKHTKPIHRVFKDDYINYNLTNQGDELNKKLKDLEENHATKNSKLSKKIERLYVLKKEEAKINFVFSRVGGGEKEELRELLEIMGKEETGKLYRGQANSSWNLDASITREPKYLNNEAEMYYEILSLKPDAFKNDISVYERLITMQHFGMPTRLLDITRNPLVAIFFSCNNWECKDNDGVIFTFKPKDKSDFLNFEDPRLEHLSSLFNHSNVKESKEAKVFLSKIWYIKGVAKNQRISNQSGDFIFVGKGDEVATELHQFPKMTIIIDSETKKVLLEQLDSLNIHGGAVYPDLTHMSNYISTKYKNDTKSISVSELVKGLISEEKKETKPKKTTIKKAVSIKSFDFKSIKGKKREIQVNAFAKFYDLDSKGLDKIIVNIHFTKKEPYRDEVLKMMTKKPPLREMGRTLNLLIEQILTLSKIIEPTTE